MPEQHVIESRPLNGLAADRHEKIALRFERLAAEWRKQHRAMSSVTEMSMLPSYQQIIGLGEDAIPMILRELKAEGGEPDQWFWALRAIAEVNPVPPADQGDFVKMAQAWIKWGESEGYAR